MEYKMNWSYFYRNYLHAPLPYIHNRWIDPSDRVIIKHPEYPQGHYHDKDCVMMYVMFQLLVDYVEIECGSWGTSRFETSWQRWVRRFKELPLLHWFVKPVRNARRGLHHLRWEMSLKDHPTQSESAKEIFALYKFWKHTRPRREDPWVAADDFGDDESREGKRFGSWSPRYSEFLTRAGDLEDRYDQEDAEMLVRILKIRTCMWT
jgi:hypothetical protein